MGRQDNTPGLSWFDDKGEARVASDSWCWAQGQLKQLSPHHRLTRASSHGGLVLLEGGISEGSFAVAVLAKESHAARPQSGKALSKSTEKRQGEWLAVFTPIAMSDRSSSPKGSGNCPLNLA